MHHLIVDLSVGDWWRIDAAIRYGLLCADEGADSFAPCARGHFVAQFSCEPEHVAARADYLLEAGEAALVAHPYAGERQGIWPAFTERMLIDLPFDDWTLIAQLLQEGERVAGPVEERSLSSALRKHLEEASTDGRRGTRVVPPGTTSAMRMPLHSAPWTATPELYSGGRELVWNQPNTNTAAGRRLEEQWMALFARRLPLERLRIVGRLRQPYVDMLARQRSLQVIELHTVEAVTSLEPLAELPDLRSLTLVNARSLTDVAPLARLPRLEHLELTVPMRNVFDVRSLGRLSGLQVLRFGLDGFSSRWLDIPDVHWLGSLRALKQLHLIALRPADPDLAAILQLKDLHTLGLPLRREFRSQVARYAAEHRGFAFLAEEFAGYDEMVREWKRRE